MGMGSVANHEIALLHHLLGHIGMVVQGASDDRLGKRYPQPMQQVSFRVLDPLHTHRTMQREKYTVQLLSFQMDKQRVDDGFIRIAKDYSRRHRYGAERGYDHCVQRDGRQEAAQLASRSCVLFDHRASLQVLFTHEAVQCSGNNRECIGFVNERANGDSRIRLLWNVLS